MDLNKQPREKTSKANTIELFKTWPTIQGEGPFAGLPALFIRLAGCNLQCPLCDTDYTSHRHPMTIEAAVETIYQLYGLRYRLCVITGGEPFRQRGLGPFARALNDRGYLVQIETNGTLFTDNFPFTSPSCIIVCSPKANFIHPKLKPYINALKYVVEAGHTCPHTGLPTRVLGKAIIPPAPWHGFNKDQVYVQPLDEQDPVKNRQHMDEAVRVCMQYGYRLCLQTHKIAGLE